MVFVPSLGDFFSINKKKASKAYRESFRPLSRGLFFNLSVRNIQLMAVRSFRPLSRGLFFNSVPAKPQPVCSRERIRGGDGWIASSGTLLRR